MTSRERVRAALDFQPPDQLPCHEMFWDDTIPTWQQQGMPADVHPSDYFGLDIAWMYLDTSPQCPQRQLRREGGYITYQDRYGCTITKPVDKTGSLDFKDHVTTDRNAWEKLKPQLTLSPDPNAPARIDDASYFAHMDPYPDWPTAQRKYRALRDTNRYVLFRAYGPWNAAWRHRGMEQLMMDLIESPDWVQDMAETYQSLVIAILRKCLDMDMRPDGFIMFEDLGWKKSMLISPQAWRRYLLPSVQRVGQFLRDNRIDFWTHSDGAIEPIIDDLIECGLKLLNPLETAAGLNVVEMRRRYGKRLAFWGNISVTNMLGPKEALRAEIHQKVPIARQGGYIFGSDHSVPPQVSFERYRWMLAEARACFLGKTQG
ncbi:uroporphyrinogen decarboxylase family protein [Fontivita pretiosa]|uniref:uroporphyrinogen decarboxylase family protein n=1 Tax=Fontivita pretiosa TaxID=2989684 RepID=UPI003D177ACD